MNGCRHNNNIYLHNSQVIDIDSNSTDGLDVELNYACANAVDHFHNADTTIEETLPYAHSLVHVMIERTGSADKF